MSVRSRSLVILAVTLLSVAAVGPVAAKPNNNTTAVTKDGLPALDICDGLKQLLDKHEKLADQNAGTKKAAKHAKEADEAWSSGATMGCSWAQ